MRNLSQHIKQYQLLSDWYLSVLEDITNEDACKQVYGFANSMEWLAGHLNIGRYRLLMILDLTSEPYNNMDKFIHQTRTRPTSIPFSTQIQYPTLEESKAQWIIYSTSFLSALKDGIDERILNMQLPFSFPTGGNTYEEALTSIALHESYHIGQMSSLRKVLGYKSMNLNLRK